VSNLAEMKQRVDNLKELLMGMKDKVTGLVQAVLPELQAVLKKEGKKLGIGSGILLVGLGVMGVAALYLVYALMLVLDLAVKRMWLSALIVVGAMLLGGGFFALVGGIMSYKSARKLQKTAEFTTKGATELAKSTVEEAQKEVGELQVLAKQEVDVRKRQALELLDMAKRFAPAAIGMFLLFALVWRRHRKKKKLLAQTPVVIKEVIHSDK
jgi:hypothetical protein